MLVQNTSHSLGCKKIKFMKKLKITATSNCYSAEQVVTEKKAIPFLNMVKDIFQKMQNHHGWKEAGTLKVKIEEANV